ncbi:Family 31 glucosidase [Aeromicrobium sp. 9AM]|nr:Family 31 glucosidase [Aeromicrobium sp. 9AM]
MNMFRIEGSALEVQHRHERLRIEPWGKDSVRVRAAQFAIPTDSVGALDDVPDGSQDPIIKIEDDRALLVHGEATVEVTFSREQAYPEPLIRFLRTSTGEELLAESREHFWMPGSRVFQGNRAGAYEIHQQFSAYDGERLYGMGQRTHGRLNLKGLSLDLVQRNAEVNIPFVLSSRGYGLLWNMPGIGRAEFNDDVTRWTATQARGLDYWFSAAPTPGAILGSYADATGHVPDLPDWASGFWQSKLRYLDQEELMGVAREHRRRDLPMSVIVTDYFHWSAMGDYRFDEAEWPDPQGMVDELGGMGIELMVSIWPTVSPLSENFADYRDGGLLVGSDQGIEFHQTIQDKGMTTPLPLAFYDPTNPETREYVWGLVKQNYLDLGIKVFWLDACEPELNPAHPANLALYAGPGAEVANIYPRDNARMFAEGMASAGQDPTVLLCRSAWAGSQRYGAAVWSGDIPATWLSLTQQVRAGLNIAISGIPWWTTDIGGFHGGDASDPAYQELMVRWFQFGVFCPLFRLHGDRDPRTPTGYAQTGGPNEVWSYGDEAYEIIAEQLRLRERLRPYIHEHMTIASETGLPPMRPLFVDHADDPQAWQVEDEFMFGDSILVAPVTEPGATSRDVYLPAGHRWVDVRTREVFEGGSTHVSDAPISSIPVFVIDGSAVLESM